MHLAGGWLAVHPNAFLDRCCLIIRWHLSGHLGARKYSTTSTRVPAPKGTSELGRTVASIPFCWSVHDRLARSSRTKPQLHWSVWRGPMHAWTSIVPRGLRDQPGAAPDHHQSTTRTIYLSKRSPPFLSLSLLSPTIVLCRAWSPTHHAWCKHARSRPVDEEYLFLPALVVIADRY